MVRQIKITFPDSEVEVVATLLEKDSPATCEYVWGLLEQVIDTRVKLDHSSGGEMFFQVPPAPGLSSESPTVFPAPGDLLFSHCVRGFAGGEAVDSIGIFFDRGGRCLRSEGWVAGNVFAKVTQNLSGLQRVARDVAAKGPQSLRIERVPQCPLPFLRNGVVQVGQLVKDIDQAVERYWQLFGIGPWKIYTYGKPLLKTLEYRGQPSDLTWRIAICWIGPLCLELMEVGDSESIYSDFVREHGYGLHHLAVQVEDMEAAIAQAKAAGIEVLQEGGGQGLDGSGHFAYLGTEDEIGAILELVQFPRHRVPPDRTYPA